MSFPVFAILMPSSKSSVRSGSPSEVHSSNSFSMAYLLVDSIFGTYAVSLVRVKTSTKSPTPFISIMTTKTATPTARSTRSITGWRMRKAPTFITAFFNSCAIAPAARRAPFFATFSILLFPPASARSSLAIEYPGSFLLKRAQSPYHFQKQIPVGS